MRQKILELIIATLEPKDFVLALWQGGSAAHGSTDEWSDIDIQVIVEDERVQETFDIVEESLKTSLRFDSSGEFQNLHGTVILNASIN
jgi:predicted nucleotidyltransferase